MCQEKSSCTSSYPSSSEGLRERPSCHACVTAATRDPKVTSAVRPDQCLQQMAVGLTEMSIPQTQTTVRVGPFEFENVPTGLHASAMFAGEAGLLGNGLLSRFATVTIDGKAGRIILGQRRPME